MCLQGLKPNIFYKLLAARLKPSPDTKRGYANANPSSANAKRIYAANRTYAGCKPVAMGFLFLLMTASVLLSDTAPETPSWVTVFPVAKITVSSGKPASVRLRFKVAEGYHINSNQPGSELLIPTKLQLNPPTDIGVGSITYPQGHDLILAVAPDQPLNVYTGEFAITGKVSAMRSASPGKYMVHGQLKYQACNDRSCFPPKLAPVEFEIQVVKPASSGGSAHNPAQSPHIHN
jgi:hypothetical protein